MLQELFWVHFFGHPYHSNATKIHLDVALLRNPVSGHAISGNFVI